MRRSTVIAIAGVAIAGAGAVWHELARRGTAREIRVNGMSAGLAIIGLGVVMVVAGLVVTVIGRRRSRRYATQAVATTWPDGWPTIVVRDHRRRPPQMRSLPPSA
jgi:hypothetical protein